eukprot:56059-Eustigmatos_ZCMA.PRE.1
MKAADEVLNDRASEKLVAVVSLSPAGRGRLSEYVSALLNAAYAFTTVKRPGPTWPCTAIGAGGE